MLSPSQPSSPITWSAGYTAFSDDTIRDSARRSATVWGSGVFPSMPETMPPAFSTTSRQPDAYTSRMMAPECSATSMQALTSSSSATSDMPLREMRRAVGGSGHGRNDGITGSFKRGRCTWGGCKRPGAADEAPMSHGERAGRDGPWSETPKRRRLRRDKAEEDVKRGMSESGGKDHISERGCFPHLGSPYRPPGDAGHRHTGRARGSR